MKHGIGDPSPMVRQGVVVPGGGAEAGAAPKGAADDLCYQRDSDRTVQVRSRLCHMCLSDRYAMSGTDLLYRGTSATLPAGYVAYSKVASPLL
eukprot:3025177-Rhodomonas_salina.1